MTGPQRLPPVDIKLLLRMQGEQFVSEVYAKILGRSPDPAGLAHHLELLNTGTMKLEIIRRIHTSEEGCRVGVSIVSLRTRVALQKLGGVPIIGGIFRIMQRQLYGPTFEVSGEHSHIVARKQYCAPSTVNEVAYAGVANSSQLHNQYALRFSKLNGAINHMRETLTLNRNMATDFQTEVQSIKTAAVIAHFDPSNRLDDTFLRVLSQFAEICERIVLVTTCDLPEHELPRDPKVITICRPNIGYDFYSYKVGIEEILRFGGCQELFLANSSFVVLNAMQFGDGLLAMRKVSGPGRVIGVTESIQFERHLQSYLLLLDGGLLERDWLRVWLDGIHPKNSKMEAILTYELGLSRLFRINGAELFSALTLSDAEKASAAGQWGTWRKKNSGEVGDETDVGDDYNPVHFAARQLAHKFGIAKSELLRSNPHDLDLGWLPDITDADAIELVNGFMARSRENYRSSSDGLTILDTNKGSPVPAFRLICSGPLARPQVRIAVVVHIFYTNLVDEILSLLSNIVEPFDLYITTPFEESIPLLLNKFVPLAQTVAVAVFENRGRDMGPFVGLHRSRLLDGYAAVLKLHSKQSRYSEQGGLWRQKLYSELCGSYQTVSRVMDMLSNPSIGMVGPHDYYLSHAAFWGGNLERVRTLLASVGVLAPGENPSLGFFGGSMFWYKPSAMLWLHDIPDELLSFEDEAGQRDATLAHAFERIFCNIAKHAGYFATSLRADGADIAALSDVSNTVPVLQRPPVEA